MFITTKVEEIISSSASNFLYCASSSYCKSNVAIYACSGAKLGSQYVVQYSTVVGTVNDFPWPR